mmetsp:Transcript_22583/g.21758  ORF Transcript_22583/g.21758 Transcript_22583/m.21758 type:complete len:90 (-) Transcript_22583:732-1001(-)
MGLRKLFSRNSRKCYSLSSWSSCCSSLCFSSLDSFLLEGESLALTVLLNWLPKNKLDLKVFLGPLFGELDPVICIFSFSTNVGSFSNKK